MSQPYFLCALIYGVKLWCDSLELDLSLAVTPGEHQYQLIILIPIKLFAQALWRVMKMNVAGEQRVFLASDPACLDRCIDRQDQSTAVKLAGWLSGTCDRRFDWQLVGF